MSNLKFCPECGAKIVTGDRFCGECGIDIHSLAQSAATPLVNQQPAGPPAPQAAPAAGDFANANLGANSGGNKNALVIMISLLVVLFVAGGGLYWWLSRGEDLSQVASPPTVTQNNGTSTTGAQATTPAQAPAVDLSRAATYLPEPGLKCSFYVYYPDGTAGDVERVSAVVVPSETVRVSEVEINEENGETFGYGFHYVERADGTYYIYDDTPMEIFPVLKNNLTVGQTWNYQDEFGPVVWEVVDMGVSLDLGFTTLNNCLLLEEDNQAVGLKTITYYAPGMGRVMVKSSVEGAEYLKLTAFSSMDEVQAADTVKKWAANYAAIQDDRTQS